MPVLHNSPEWQRLNETATETKVKVGNLEDAFRQLSERQERQHRDNVQRMDELEEAIGAVRDELAQFKEIIAEVKGVLEGLKSAAKVVSWLLGLIIALITLYGFFGPSIRHAVGLPNAKSAPTVSELYTAPQDARIPTLH